MTLEEVIDMVRHKYSETSDAYITPAIIAAYTNDALEEIASRNVFEASIKYTGTANITANATDGYYEVPIPSDFIDFRIVKIDGKQYDKCDLADVDAFADAFQTRWFQRENKIAFTHGIEPTTTEILLYYYKKHTTVSTATATASFTSELNGNTTMIVDYILAKILEDDAVDDASDRKMKSFYAKLSTFAIRRRATIKGKPAIKNFYTKIFREDDEDAEYSS